MKRQRFGRSTGSIRYCRFSPGAPSVTGFEYYRHGTLSLHTALDTQSGKVLGKITARHTSQEFVEFLTEVVERAPAREVHIILDYLAHKSHVVRDLLASHLNVHFEIWFSKVERGVIAREIFTSVKDLARRVRRCIDAYSANGKPIQWRYSDPTRRIRSNPSRCSRPHVSPTPPAKDGTRYRGCRSIGRVP